MPWPRRFLFIFLVGLLAWGVVLFALGLETRLFEEGQAALSRALFRGIGRELALLVLHEVRKNSLSFQVLRYPLPERPSFEVEVVLENARQRERLLKHLETLLAPLRPFGLWGKAVEDDDYRLFWGEEEWFRFSLRLRRVFRVAIVIDDIGYDVPMAEKFFSLPVKLNVAVFPHLPYGPHLARRAEESGKEVLIHFPMEAMDPGENSGERFLLRSGTPKEEVVRMLEEAFRRIPQARGLNNHKGSRATQDERLMALCALVLREKNAYFLDSLTTPRSVAFRVMKGMGVRALRRDVFLDGETTVEYVLKQLETTLAVARKAGFAVAIGHPKEVTYEALRRFLEKPHPEYEFVFLSEMFEDGG
uniref:Divergent polysaccharide deacetylase family protein n=1 Tax=Candidatus Caldatribacterium californiense TaxID=1454726 RepID=A0A7V3YFH8_9BACT